MKKFVLFTAFVFLQLSSYAQTLPHVVKNAGFFSHGIKLTVCNFDTAYTYLSINHKLVADSIYSDACGVWFLVSLPSVTQGVDTSGWICGALAALCDMVPDAGSDYVKVVNAGSNGLFVRPAPVAGNVTINGAFAKIWDGQRFALTGNTQMVGGATWYEIYLTENCSQTTGWVSGNFVQVINGTTDVSEFSNLSISISPNPFSGFIAISLESNMEIELNLYDNAGKLIIEETFFSSINIPTEKISVGTYLYKLRTKNGIIQTGKLIKK